MPVVSRLICRVFVNIYPAFYISKAVRCWSIVVWETRKVIDSVARNSYFPRYIKKDTICYAFLIRIGNFSTQLYINAMHMALKNIWTREMNIPVSCNQLSTFNCSITTVFCKKALHSPESWYLGNESGPNQWWLLLNYWICGTLVFSAPNGHMCWV